jgi:hypothetical protein
MAVELHSRIALPRLDEKRLVAPFEQGFIVGKFSGR